MREKEGSALKVDLEDHDRATEMSHRCKNPMFPESTID